MPTQIEWTEETWNPIRAKTDLGDRWNCRKVSPGCDHCYAERLNIRFGGTPYQAVDVPDAKVREWSRLDEKALQKPLRMRRARRIFVCSMSDLFGEWVPSAWIQEMWLVMTQQARHHTYQILTKRPKRMRDWTIAKASVMGWPVDEVWPDNVWLGTSIESQEYAWRLNYLSETPAKVRFVSVEPLLGPVDLRGIGIFPDWVIVGGESGGPLERQLTEPCFCCGHYPHDGMVQPLVCSDCGGTHWEPRLEAYEWVSDLRDQTKEAGSAFLFKQWGGRTPKAGGRLLDGRTWDEYPA